MFMSSSDYKESLRRYKPRVFVDGERIDSVADAPSLQPGINALGVSYDYALRDELAPLMRAVQASSGKTREPDAAHRHEQRRPAEQARGGSRALPGDRLRAALSRARCVQRARPGDRADRRRQGHRLPRALLRLPARRAGPRHQRRHRDDRREGRPQQASAPAGEPGQLRPHRRAHAAGHRHLGHQGDRDGGAVRARVHGHAVPQHERGRCRLRGLLRGAVRCRRPDDRRAPGRASRREGGAVLEPLRPVDRRC